MEAINEELLHKQAEEAALSHYGVLGMKWGRRKAEPRYKMGGRKQRRAERKAENRRKDSSIAKGYTEKIRNVDKHVWSKATRQGINRRMHDGESYGKAAAKSVAKETGKGLIGAAAGLAIAFTPLALAMGYNALSDAANAKKAADGAKMAANLFADAKGLTSYETISLAFGSNAGGKKTWRL